VDIKDAFTALTLLVWCQEEHPAWKNFCIKAAWDGSKCRLAGYSPKWTWFFELYRTNLH